MNKISKSDYEKEIIYEFVITLNAIRVRAGFSLQEWVSS